MARYIDVDFNMTVRVDAEKLPIDVRKELGRGMYDTIYDHEIYEVIKDHYQKYTKGMFDQFNHLVNNGDFIEVNAHALYVWGVEPSEVEGESK